MDDQQRQPEKVNMEGEKKQGQMIFKYFLILFLVSGLLLGKLLWPFMSILILAFVLTGIFYPLYTFFLKKIRPHWASLVTCLVIFLVVFVPIVFFVGALSQEAYGLYQVSKDAAIAQYTKDLLQNSEWADKIQKILEGYNIQLDSESFNKALSTIGKEVGLYLYEQARAIASNMLSFIINALLMVMIIYFLLLDGQKLVDFVVDLSPLPAEQDQKLIAKFQEMAGAVLIGNGLAGLIQGILGGITFAFFGLSSPFLWGFIMALLAFLPIVGISVVFIPAAIYLFLKGRITAGIAFVVIYVLITGVVEYLLKPKLVGHKVKMHTLLIILSILGGLKVFGILGIIYGPLIMTAFLTLTEIYRTSYETFVREK
ncbi:MAG: AI-2E family transporter [Pseudomonadota bacterium]